MKLAQTIADMALRYVVITSVTVMICAMAVPSTLRIALLPLGKKPANQN